MSSQKYPNADPVWAATLAAHILEVEIESAFNQARKKALSGATLTAMSTVGRICERVDNALENARQHSGDKRIFYQIQANIHCTLLEELITLPETCALLSSTSIAEIKRLLAAST
jgi:hypothetical protein